MDLDLGAWARHIREVPVDQCGTLYVMFSQLAAVASARLMLARPVQLGLDGGGRLLTSKEAAQLTGLTARWFYERAATLPFARRPSPGRLRFDEAGLRRWMEGRKNGNAGPR